MRKFGWGVMTVMATLVALYAWVSAFTSARTPFVEALFEQKNLRALGHLAGGGIAIVAGALQFSTRLRFERPTVHRNVGKLYLVAVLVSGVGGALLAPSSTGGVVAHFGFGMLAALWLGTSLAAFVSVRSGDYQAHRCWMIRSYALCLAAVMLRLYLPLFGVLGVPFESSYPAISWLCWVPNLIVAEWWIMNSSIAPLEPAQ